MDKLLFVTIVTVLLISVQFISACDIDQTAQGCRIKNKACSCGHGCKSEYRYPNMHECTEALKGKRADMCFNNPCMNGGSCIQISRRPGFRCRCDGTGYYGQRCHQKCPQMGQSFGEYFPYECIVI